MEHESTPRAEPIVFRGRLSEADVVDLQWCYDRLIIRHSIRRLVMGLSGFLAALSLGTVILRWCLRLETATSAYVVTVTVVLVWVYSVFGLRIERAWQARRRYRRHPKDYPETQMTLSEDRVLIENEAYKSEFRWSMVTLIAVSPSGLMFCNSARQGLFWLPNRLFEGNDLRERTIALAERNGVAIRQVV